jgi:hypothetical protein
MRKNNQATSSTPGPAFTAPKRCSTGQVGREPGESSKGWDPMFPPMSLALMNSDDRT